MRRRRRRLGVTALGSLLGFSATPSWGGAVVSLDPIEVLPGGIARVVAEASCADPSGTVDGRTLDFFPVGESGVRVALIGVDLEVEPGVLGVEVRCGERLERLSLAVHDHVFPREELTVATRYVHPSEEERRRAEEEAGRLKQLWQRSTPERLWRGPFRLPAAGPSGTPFGLRRVYNGEPRSPHNGIDVRASHGTPVVAANRGRVVVSEELFYSGNTVILDHGLGLYTVYLHLSRLDVSVGALVGKGERIGRVGATGRVTGPHLHFSSRLAGARVEPMQLINDGLDEPALR